MNRSDPDQNFPFYKKLNQLKADNPALWNGEFGGIPEKLEDDNHEVFSIRRSKDGNTVFAIINMSGKEQTVKFSTNESVNFSDVFSGDNVQLTELKLKPWQYLVGIENK